jgi:hypothetical protein
VRWESDRMLPGRGALLHPTPRVDPCVNAFKRNNLPNVRKRTEDLGCKTYN